MDFQTFILGVENSQVALNACGRLSFVTIDAGAMSTPPHIKMTMGQIDQGVVVVFQGEFSDVERREILGLGAFDHEATRPAVLDMVTDLTQRLVSQGAGAAIHILTKGDAE